METKKYLIAGIGFGDEGKGRFTDYLTSKINPDYIVRYNGGPQTAHHVVYNNKVHCFSQFGSGTFIDGVKTILSKYMLINPISIIEEEKFLKNMGMDDAYNRLIIDENCLIVTPIHKIIGQMREILNNHGSCGMGVGETMRDGISMGEYALRVKDIFDNKILREKLEYLFYVKLDQAEQLKNIDSNNLELKKRYSMICSNNLIEMINREYCDFLDKANISSREIFSKYQSSEKFIFEGAQGVLLDNNYGFYPHITKTRTTFDNALKLLDDYSEIEKIAILRAYSTRHGAGPFVTEDIELGKKIPDLHNKTGQWQGNFRIGWFDIIASKYALDVIGDIDYIALTNIDRLENIPLKICTQYSYSGKEKIDDIFEYDKRLNGEKVINRIKKIDPNDFDTRIKLTNCLFDCKPIYENFNGSLDDYVSFIESKNCLNVHIKYLSNGYNRNAIIER